MYRIRRDSRGHAARDLWVHLRRQGARGVPAPYSAPSLRGRHPGTAVAGVAVKFAANSRQTEVSSSRSALFILGGSIEYAQSFSIISFTAQFNKYS